MTNKAKKKSTPGWSDVKLKLTELDGAGLLALVQDLYSASKENQAFLHARFGLGADVLAPYKATISRWLWPDIWKNQDTSISKAKKAIADYKKAIGRPEGLAELMTFYCEQAAGYSRDVSLQDEGYFYSLVGMFAQALKATFELPAEQRDALMKRLNEVRHVGHDLGYGVGDEMDDVLLQYWDED